MRYRVINTSNNQTVTCDLGDKSSLYLYPKKDIELTEEQFTGYFYNVPFLIVEEVAEKTEHKTAEAHLEQKKNNFKRGSDAEENNEKED